MLGDVFFPKNMECAPNNRTYHLTNAMSHEAKSNDAYRVKARRRGRQGTHSLTTARRQCCRAKDAATGGNCRSIQNHGVVLLVTWWEYQMIKSSQRKGFVAHQHPHHKASHVPLNFSIGLTPDLESYERDAGVLCDRKTSSS